MHCCRNSSKRYSFHRADCSASCTGACFTRPRSRIGGPCNGSDSMRRACNLIFCFEQLAHLAKALRCIYACSFLTLKMHFALIFIGLSLSFRLMRRLNDWQVHFRLQFDLTVAADANLAAAAASSSSALLASAGGTSTLSSSGQFWSAHLWPQGVTYDALPVTARVRFHLRWIVAMPLLCKG